MWNLLVKLQKNLVWSIPVSMTFGLVYGYFFEASPLKQFIIPVTFVMVYPMMVTLNVQSIFKGHDHKLQFVTQFINFVLIPLLAYAIGKIFFSSGLEKYGLWAVGLFLIGVLPTSGMTISWTGFAKGNKEAAIKMVVFGLVLGALAAPVYTKIFMGATVNVDMLHMFRQITLFVFVPLAFGLLTQYWGMKKHGKKIWNEAIKPKFPPFSALGVTMIAFLAMALKSKSIIADPQDILKIIVPLLVFYVITYGFLSIIGRIFLKREDAIAMVFGVVMRDLSIALAIAMTAFGKQGLTIALLISLAYVVQIQSAAWYVRYVDFIFGKTAGAEDTGNTGTSNVFNNVVPLPVAEKQPAVARISKILYATDLSETARHAARYAFSLGNQYHAKVTVMHVIPDMLASLSGEANMDLTEQVDQKQWSQYNRKNLWDAKLSVARRVDELSQEASKEISSAPLAIDDILIPVGEPADNIIAAAEEGGFDLIIMGTHGHSKLEETMIGSVASDVIRKSTIPVLVIRLPVQVQNWQPENHAESDTENEVEQQIAKAV